MPTLNSELQWKKVRNKTYPKHIIDSTKNFTTVCELLRSKQSPAGMQRSLFHRLWDPVVPVTVRLNNKETDFLNSSLSTCAHRLCSTARSY